MTRVWTVAVTIAMAFAFGTPIASADDGPEVKTWCWSDPDALQVDDLVWNHDGKIGVYIGDGSCDGFDQTGGEETTGRKYAGIDRNIIPPPEGLVDCVLERVGPPQPGGDPEDAVAALLECLE